jgi:hypothetical protein
MTVPVTCVLHYCNCLNAFRWLNVTVSWWWNAALFWVILKQLWQWHCVHICIEISIKVSCWELCINVDPRSVIVSQKGLSSSHMTMPVIINSRSWQFWDSYIWISNLWRKCGEITSYSSVYRFIVGGRWATRRSFKNIHDRWSLFK